MSLFHPEAINVYSTAADLTTAEAKLASARSFQQEMQLVNLYPTYHFQQWSGFGGAVTQTVAQLYEGLSPQARHDFLEEHFSPENRNYRLVRTPVQSCDFGPGPQSFIKHLWQNPHEAFDLSSCEDQLIPMLKDIAAFNPKVEFMVTPWSPPAYMKTNHLMRFGGHLKTWHEKTWAYLIARYVHELRSRGIPVTRLSVQNEPRARQVWESCLMNASQEVRLARKIRVQLQDLGIEDVKILAWDHNKERLLDRVEEARHAWGNAGNPFDGWAFHWYAGDHFEVLSHLASEGDLGELVMSEGCEYFSTDTSARHAFGEHYAHDIIGDMNAGATAWLDWNMMLDEQGGPTYVKNFCSAPVEAHTDTATFQVLPTARYLWHFSHFVQPGARRILASSYTSNLEVTAWENPDGSLACVVLNRTTEDIPFFLRKGDHMAELNAGSHSIQTIVWEPPAATHKEKRS